MHIIKIKERSDNIIDHCEKIKDKEILFKNPICVYNIARNKENIINLCEHAPAFFKLFIIYDPINLNTVVRYNYIIFDNKSLSIYIIITQELKRHV